MGYRGSGTVRRERQHHLSHGEQSAAQDGRLLSPWRHDSPADAGLHARRVLGGGREGDRHRRAAPLARDGLERRQRRVPAGSRRRSHDARAGCGGRLFLRPALRRRAAGQLQHRHEKDRRDRRVGRRASRLVDGHHPGERGPGTGVRGRGRSAPATPGCRRPRRRTGRHAGCGDLSRDASCQYQRSWRSSTGSASPTCRT